MDPNDYSIESLMISLFSPNQNTRFEYQSKIDAYLREQNLANFNGLDLAKFFEATLLFINSDIAANNVHGLIIIQVYLKQLVDSIHPHLDRSLF
jgi:hypothetical protein